MRMESPTAVAPAASGHPFRRHIGMVLLPPSPARLRNEDQDLKLFVLSFTAFFICIYSFIA